MTIALYVTEEMCARMAVVTGKGLSDLIREEFGFRPTFFVMVTGFLVDLGQRGGGICRRGLGHGDFRRQPIHRRADRGDSGLGSGDCAAPTGRWRNFSGAVRLLSTYVISGDSGQARLAAWPPRHTVIPTMHFNAGYLLMLTALVGTTIAPWQFFYLQAGFVEKKRRSAAVSQARADVIAGSISCMIIVFFIIVCTAATLYASGHRNITDAARRGPGSGAAGREVGGNADLRLAC